MAKTNYNPYRIPFSNTIADQHRNATSAGLPNHNGKLCACCFMPVNQGQLGVGFGGDQIRHLGYEYGTFYEMVKILGGALGFVVFDCGFSQFQDTLAQPITPTTGLFGYNWSSLSPHYPSQKFWLYSTLSFVSLVFLLILMRLWSTHRSRTLKTQNSTQSQQNYSILLKNIPKSLNPQQKIQDLFKTNFHNLYIKQIFLIPNMQKYQQLKQQIYKEVNNWRELLKNQSKKKQEILETLKKIEQSNQRFNQYKEELSRKRSENFSGNAIIVFESHENQKQVLKAWKSKFFTKNKLQASFGELVLGDKETIIVEQAPSPTQINWQNIPISNSEQSGKMRFSYILVVLCQVVFFVLYFCSQLIIGRRVGVFFGENVGTVSTLVLLSILSYTLLPQIVEKIQQRQRSPTVTQLYTQQTHKLALSLIVLRSFTILAAQSVFSKGQQLAYSTLNKILILTLADLVVTFLFQLINFPDILKRIRKVIWNNKNKLTQEQANNLYKKPTHNIPLKYSILISTFMTSLIYSNLAPAILLIQLTTLLLFYWTDKINLSHRTSIHSAKISPNYLTNTLKILQLALIAKPTLNLIYWSLSKQSVPIQQIVMFVLGVFYCVGPKQIVIDWLLVMMKYQYKEADELYNEDMLESLYSVECPVTGGYAAKLQYIQNKYGSKLSIMNQSGVVGQDIDITDTIKDRIVSTYINHIPEHIPQQRPGQVYDSNIDNNQQDGNNAPYYTARRMNTLSDGDV